MHTKTKLNDMKITIRQEKPSDYKAVFDLIETAFKELKISDHKEQFLVERLRESDAFIPELSLVAEYENEIIGHILLTKIKIKNDREEIIALALAPVSVLPKFQNRGIGTMLIENAHSIAKELNYELIVLLGHARYYPRFGYDQADKFGIKLPFDVPKENCMVKALTKNGLDGVNGTVVYPKEFNE